MSGFQTNVFRDGAWHTTTVSIEQAVKASSSTAMQAPPPEPIQAPKCAILSRTVVNSPIVRWILPVRIRSSTQVDVAFVGVSSVSSFV